LPVPHDDPDGLSGDLSRSTGATALAGEEAAVRYLARCGCAILARNWRARHVEIDIVALCPFDGDAGDAGDIAVERQRVLTFVEVRTRHGRTGLAEESISARKAHSMAVAAYAYMAAHDLDPNTTPWRVDLVAIAMHGSRITSINWIRGAIDESMAHE
jgi:putative endonuclease